MPIFPAARGAQPNGLKVHVGAGTINLQGWVNVDARPLPHVHAHTSSLRLEEFRDGAVSRIYACHVLEHVSFVEAADLLAAWYTKLTGGGAIVIAVPDFDGLIRMYEEARRDIEVVKYSLMGAQDYEFNFHKAVYNYDSLKALIEQAGFRDVARWTTVEEFGQRIGDWSQVDHSLNLKAIKPAAR